jgi:putative NIF3 family GTP cyclohydrolase 1 type 2
MTNVQMIIDKLIEPVGTLTNTTDRLIAGDPDKRVSRVAVTFSSSYEVIQLAVECKADLLITHEPTFYLHQDETDWLADDEVFEKKRQLISESGITIYRFHDYWHRYQPDGILSGLLATMGWDIHARAHEPYVLDMPRATVRQIADELKLKLGVSELQLFGNPDQEISVLSLSPGMEGGKKQIEKLMRSEVDLLIVGETHSWETNDYVQDALTMGIAKSMIILGHMPSEEAGMRKVVDLVKDLFPDLDAFFIPGTSKSTWI